MTLGNFRFRLRIEKMLILGSLLLVTQLFAQTYTVIHNFTNNPDGSSPRAALTLSGDTLYGTTYTGGTASNGIVFKVDRGGTNFTVLHQFTANPFLSTNSDGAKPLGKLVINGNMLYGTASSGGYVTNNSSATANGTVFAVDTNGYVFNVLSYLPSSTQPDAGMIEYSNTLFGTSAGSVFSIQTDGTGYTNISGPVSGGMNCLASLVLDNGQLYGTSSSASLSDRNAGYVFSISTNGGSLTYLEKFTTFGTGGGQPAAPLVSHYGVLYGTAYSYQGGGTIFSMNEDGSGFTPLITFPNNANFVGGSAPVGGVVLSGSTLYGTTKWGGSFGRGIIFSIGTDGSAFTILKNFTGADGANPVVEMILDNGALYGTTSAGGTAGLGVLFSFVLPPPLLQVVNTNNSTIIYWLSDNRTHTLQTTTNLSTGPWSDIAVNWVGSNSNGTTMKAGYQLTNSTASSAAFFRLQ